MKKVEAAFFPVVIALLMALNTFSVSADGRVNLRDLRGDSGGYYAWLPALLLHRDASFNTLVDSQERYAENPNRIGLHLMDETGRYACKYSIGVALMQLPFFTLAHVATLGAVNPQAVGWEPYQYAADGYSPYYIHSVKFAGICYAVLGLLLLRGLLRRFFENDIVLMVLTSIVLGTSWLHYSAVEAGMSHAFSFFLFAAFLTVFFRWRDHGKLRDLLLLGFVSGMIALVRLPNLLIWLAVPLLLPGFLKYWKQAALIGLITAVCFLPQIWLWHYATGEWGATGYSAHDEGFNWFAPQIHRVLFGITKGMFFYAPVLLLVWGGWLRKGEMRKASLVVFAAIAYLISSWHMWWFGGGFGHRAFVESYVFLAFPLAAAFEWLRGRLRWLPWMVIGCCSLWTLWWMKLYNTREYSIQGLDFPAFYDMLYVRWHALKHLLGF